MSDLFDETQTIHTVDVVDTMQTAYLDYAMSVIAGRALPDLRDGLKPVQRRILFEMGNMNLSPGRAFVKAARVVGSVMGQWHPHGDSAIYDALVRMAQPFSLRYPLIDGHGNFGSIDGDPAAAMRYTEVRLTSVAMEMLAEVSQDTVDFIPNFDATADEPVLLPSRLPNLLMNGSMGVAVGVSTAIPPHNLTEIMNGALLLLDNPEAGIEEIMECIKGPDFPTGGRIVGIKGVREFMETGAGSITVRAKAKITPADGRKNASIVITEIPYLRTKSKIVKQIHDLASRDDIRGIRAIRDESGRRGIRMVVEVSARRDPAGVLEILYKRTDLQAKFPARMVALVDGVPVLVPMKDALANYLEHRRTTVRRRAAFELAKAEERAHIVEGLLIALSDIDKIIETIKRSKDREDAGKNLQKGFSLSKRQSDAILRLQLGTLTALERGKLEEEMETLSSAIEGHTAILEDDEVLKELLRTEMTRWRDRHGDARRTTVEKREVSDKPLIQPEMQVVILTEGNYIKRIPLTDFRSYRRGGQGVRAITLKEGDAIKQLDLCWNTDELFLFTEAGKIYSMPVYNVIEGGREAKGIPVQNYRHELKREKVVCIRGRKEEKESLMLLTEKGIIKRVRQADVAKIMRPGKKVMRVNKGDRIINAQWVDDSDRVLVVTRMGKGAHFPASEVRMMGRTAGGVRAMRLDRRDKVSDISVVGMEALDAGTVEEVEVRKDGSRIVKVRRLGLSPMAGTIVEAKGQADAFIVKIDPGNGQYRNAKFAPRSKLIAEVGATVKERDLIVALPKNQRTLLRHHIPADRTVAVRKGQKVLKHQSLTKGDKVLLVTNEGKGKLMETHHVRFTHRGGKGVKVFAIQTPSGARRKGIGHLHRCRSIGSELEVGIATTKGKLYKTTIHEISTQKRYARGVVVIKLKEGDGVADLAIV
ncbi:DNA topoisomerase 4 subunit A [bacterium]|nr:DNA topoisomerase 4 subunit A [bacterium]